MMRELLSLYGLVRIVGIEMKCDVGGAVPLSLAVVHRDICKSVKATEGYHEKQIRLLRTNC